MAIYFASSSATGVGDGSLSNPWTLQEGMDVASPDELRIIADGTYLPTATLSPTGIGTIDNPTLITGCNLTGDVDGTKADISGANLPSATDILEHTLTQYKMYNNLIVRNSPRHGIACPSGDSRLHFNNIDILNNAQWGATPLTNTNARFSFTNCLISGNMYGIGSVNSSRMSNLKLIACTIENNSNTGIYVGTGLSVLKTVVKNNGIGIRANVAASSWLISSSTFYKNTNAINIVNASIDPFIIESSIFRNNSEYAFKSGSTIVDHIIIMNNCFSNNTSGDSESGPITGNGNIHEDPLFVSEVEGEEDFNLQPTSPCINTGLNPYGY